MKGGSGVSGVRILRAETFPGKRIWQVKNQFHKDLDLLKGVITE